jgi:hypothetical protein
MSIKLFSFFSVNSGLVEEHAFLVHDNQSFSFLIFVFFLVVYHNSCYIYFYIGLLTFKWFMVLFIAGTKSNCSI